MAGQQKSPKRSRASAPVRRSNLPGKTVHHRRETNPSDDAGWVRTSGLLELFFSRCWHVAYTKWSARHPGLAGKILGPPGRTLSKERKKPEEHTSKGAKTVTQGSKSSRECGRGQSCGAITHGWRLTSDFCQRNPIMVTHPPDRPPPKSPLSQTIPVQELFSASLIFNERPEFASCKLTPIPRLTTLS